MNSWQVYIKYRRNKATADAYAASKMQQQVFLAWSQEAGQARSKATAAVNMAARVQARVHNQLVFECFAAWREQAQKAAAVKVGRQAAALHDSGQGMANRTWLHWCLARSVYSFFLPEK